MHEVSYFKLLISLIEGEHALLRSDITPHIPPVGSIVTRVKSHVTSGRT